ncbi:hypothetical protein DH2020_049314 [Rehmannia glutinosa]|uniref:Small EDRK-rich factor-like N-terminal domain-containing protein n=1 Tax=Rehmannia glutinosa TaxID=99300 RepID=A0ABR0U3M9_REHGL
MTRGKQKLEAQKKNAEKNQKGKGSQLEARAVGLKVVCPVYGLIVFLNTWLNIEAMGTDSFLDYDLNFQAQLANHNQLVDHYGSKHPKEKPPSNS